MKKRNKNFNILFQNKMTVTCLGNHKPYFSNKGIKTSGNILSDSLISKEIETAREFNIHLQSITSSLGLFKWPDSSESLNEPDPIKSIANN